MVLTRLKALGRLKACLSDSLHKARRAIVLAQEEARELNHNYIGTEHLLLGAPCTEAEGIGARALIQFGLTLEGTRAEVTAIVGAGKQPAPGPGTSPSRRARRRSSNSRCARP